MRQSLLAFSLGLEYRMSIYDEYFLTNKIEGRYFSIEKGNSNKIGVPFPYLFNSYLKNIIL